MHQIPSDVRTKQIFSPTPGYLHDLSKFWILNKKLHFLPSSFHLIHSCRFSPDQFKEQCWEVFNRSLQSSFLSKQISDNRTRQTSTQLQKLSLTNLEYPIIPSPDFSQIGSPDLSEWKVARMFLKRLSNKHQQLYNLLLNKQSLDFLLLILFFSEKPTDTPFPKIHKQSDIFTRLIRVEGPFKNFSNVEFSIILPFHRQTTHHFYLIRTIDFNP